MFWVNFSSLGWCTFSSAAIYFYLALTHKERILKNKLNIILPALISAFFIYQQWSGHLVALVIQKQWGWAGVWLPSIYSYLYYAYIGISTLLCVALTINLWRKAKTPHEKHLAQLLSLTASISLLLGSVTDIILPLIGQTIIPQFADILVIFWELGIVLAVTEYGLMSLTPIIATERILSTMTDALMLLDTQGTVKLANQAAVELIEIPENGLIGTNFESHVLEKTAVKSLLEETLRCGKSVNQELTFVSRSNRRIPIQVSTSCIIDHMKTTLGFVVVARDITNRKLAEANLRQRNAELKESEDYQRNLLSSLLTGVVTIDPQTHKIVDLNSYASQLFGTRKEDIVGHICHNFICPAESGKCPVTDLKQKIDFSERKILKSDGLKSTVIKSVFTIERGSKEYLIETITDIEPLKQAQASLLESEQRYKYLYEQEKKERTELEEEAKARAQFINVLAHELRTPLTPVLLSVEALSNFLSDNPDSIQYKLISNTLSSAQSLKNRLEELLDLARFARGAFKLKPQLIDTSITFQ